jgi:hypothetical protein
VPRWRPPFVTALAAEDRCHLNGLALVDGGPKYATALGETDTAGGWRANKPQGGCLLDVPTGNVVARSLSMPNSPRLHDGRLWLLESGTGQLVLVDPATGCRQTVASLPGFTRGLALCGPYAFVGLSKIRATSAMDGVPLAERREQLKCGVAVVDWRIGQNIALLEFQTAVEEIFDVQLLPGLRFPEVVGFQKEAVHHTFIVPPENRAPLSPQAQGMAWPFRPYSSEPVPSPWPSVCVERPGRSLRESFPAGGPVSRRRRNRPLPTPAINPRPAAIPGTQAASPKSHLTTHASLMHPAPCTCSRTSTNAGVE